MEGSEQFNSIDLEIEEEADRNLSPVADQLVAIAEKLRTGELSAELEDLAAAKRLSEAASPPKARMIGGARAKGLSSDRRLYADTARLAYDLRRSRGTVFGDHDLFGEPAWDILLDLYVAHCDDKPVSVSSACIGSAAPPTTGLRWLGVLTEQGLILREHDPDDQRRVLVRLSDSGLGAMDRYFEQAAQRGAL